MISQTWLRRRAAIVVISVVAAIAGCADPTLVVRDDEVAADRERADRLPTRRDESRLRFDSEFRLRVFAEPETEFEESLPILLPARACEIGQTPSHDGRGIPLPSGGWYVKPIDLDVGADALCELLRELDAKGVPGVDLLGCDHADQQVIESLAKMKSLRTLALPSGANDAMLASVGGVHPLQKLQVSSPNEISRSGWQSLVALSALQRIEVEVQNRDEIEALKGTSALPRLPALSVGCCASITDEDLQCLADVAGISELYLFFDPPSVTDAGLAALARLPRLRTITILGSNVNGSGFGVFRSSQTLEQICVGRMDAHRFDYVLDDAGVAALCEIPNIRVLELVCARNITDACLRDIGKLARLEALKLFACPELTGRGLRENIATRNLRILECIGVAIEDEDVPFITENRRLQRLAIEAFRLSSDSLTSLCTLNKLESMVLHGATLAPATARRIASLPHLANLDLEFAKGLDAGVLLEVSECGGLRSLDLAFCEEVTDEGVQHLSKLKKLESLELRSCKGVTDNAVPSLVRLESLRSLNISRTSITPGGVERLKAALPNTEIDASR